MKRVVLLISVVALGCSSGGGAERPKATAAGEAVHRCDSGEAHARALVCLADDDRAGLLAEGVSRWKPEHWLSSLFQLRSVRARYALTDAEVQCLIQTFCKGKIQ